MNLEITFDLPGLLVIGLALGSAGVWWRLGGVSADMRLHQLAPDVYVYRGFFSNSAVFVLPRSVVVIDTQTTPEVALRLRRQIAAVTDKPILHVINTHYHGDHVGGNGAFPEATVIAPEETARFVVERDGERAEYCHTFGLHLQGMPPVRGPDRTFRGEMELEIDGEKLVIAQIGRNETPDACVVRWPSRGVVAVGDGVATDQYPWLGVPFLDEGFQDDGQWLGYLRTIRGWRPSVLIPGHGRPLVGERTVASRLKLLEELLEALLREVRLEIGRKTLLPELVLRVDRRLRHYRLRPELAERVVSQRFAIFRAYNSLHPDRRGKGWWHELRPPVIRVPDAAELAAATAGAEGGALLQRARRFVRKDRPLALALLAKYLEKNPDDAEVWAERAEIEMAGAIRTRPIVDASEYIAAAGRSATRALQLRPGQPLASLNQGIVEVWGALVTGQAMDRALERLEAALAAPELTWLQRLRGRFFLAKAHQAEGRDAASDESFRALLGPLRFLDRLLLPRLRTLP